MVRRPFVRLSLVASAIVALLPSAAFAQSGIAGVVKDTTGAVLPGVTVEGSSPALIEKVRIVVTDDQGQYKIVDLRPGLYAVTFTLPGFGTVRREGIELSAAFTATVNAELKVGTLAETILVSGAAAQVDVQNVTKAVVVNPEVMAALPSGRAYQSFGALIPGISGTPGSGQNSAQDVGGSMGETRVRMVIHGGRPPDTTLLLDGLPFNATFATSIPIFSVNSGEAQEFNYQLGAISADTMTGGVRVNIIPQTGGNTFKGTIFFGYSNQKLQANNLTPGLQERGLTAVNRLAKIWDVNLSLGGPVKRDKLWFFSSFRHWGQNDLIAGMFYDQDPHDNVFTPDQSRQAVNDSWNRSESIRLTWQATTKHKFGAYVVNQGRAFPHFQIGTTRSPEAASDQQNPVSRIGHSSWTAPLTNRLLFDAGLAIVRYDQNITNGPLSPENVLAITELSTGLNFRASNTPYFRTNHNQNSFRGSMSYVTGSHAFKVGVDGQHATQRGRRWMNGDIDLRVLRGVPTQVVVWATPIQLNADTDLSMGIYGQDQWTLKRMTINAGLRFDYHHGSVPEASMPAGAFVPARSFARVEDVPNWKDLSPRLGIAYDLFGTGKTAVKATLSRYVGAQATEFASRNNPVNTSVLNTTRQWTDHNGDFIPQENELGPLLNPNFGNVVIRTRDDDDIRKGFGKRDYNWETSASIQHEVRPGMSVDIGYFRRSYGNFLVTDNLLAGPDAYSTYCVTPPVDPRLPDGGGKPICGFFDINPGVPNDNLVTFAKNYGRQYERFNGVDLNLNLRLPRGARLTGGVATGKTTRDNCDVAGKVDNAQLAVSTSSDAFSIASPSNLYCHQETPFDAQVKFLGTLTLPLDLEASATFQNIPGPQITASYTVTSDQVRASLGRNLTAGAATVELIAPGTLYDKRLTQVDFRLAKIFRVGRARIQGNLDLYNLFNVSTVLRLITTYGPAWQRPSYVLPGRMFKFGGQVDF